MKSYRLFFAILVFSIFAGSARVARGADTPAAQTLFLEGREAMKRGDLPTACSRFEESQRLAPAPGTLLNLATCEEKIGQLASAWANALGVRDLLPAEDERAAMAASIAARLEARLPRLTVRLADPAPHGTRVRRDDRELGPGALGSALALDPGRHSLTVDAPGFLPRSYDVTISEAEHVELVVAPGPALTEAAPASREATPNRTPGWILFAGSGAALATGTIFGVLAIDRRDTMSAHCDASRTCDAEGIAAGRTGSSYDVASTISFIAAGVFVSAGAVWLFTQRAPRR